MSSHKFNLLKMLNDRSCILITLLATGLYWVYHIIVSQMIIIHDAHGYEKLGILLNQRGWGTYLATGPNREPLYPLLVSFSFKLDGLTALFYQDIQKILQVSFLMISQLLTLKILKKLNIHTALICATLLYIGLSPSLLNSALSLYSEVAVYPFVLGLVLIGASAWEGIFQGRPTRMGFLGWCWGLCLIGALAVKALFAYILPFVTLPFIILLIHAFKLKQRNILINISAFVCVFLLTTQCLTVSYKLLNKKYNGHYVLTDRGPFMFYANVKKRTAPKSLKDILAFLSHIPGDEICQQSFGDDVCFTWTSHADSTIGNHRIGELRAQGHTPAQIDKQLIIEGRTMMMRNPLNYSFFYFFEGLKMIFWESTTIGFVAYPDWLSHIYGQSYFKYGIKLFMFFLTLSAMVFIIRYTYRHRRSLIRCDHDSKTCQLTLFLSIIMTSYIALNAFFFILTRFSFPIIPLYLISIAFFLQRVFIKKET